LTTAAEDQAAGVTTQVDGLLKKMELIGKLDAKVSKYSGGGGGGEKSDYEKAVESLKEQQSEASNTTRAYSKLVSAGFSAAAAFKSAKDPILAAALASTKVGTGAWKKLVQLIKDANKAAASRELKDLLTQTKVDNTLTQSFTKIVPLLSKIGLSAEQISDIFSNPVIAQKFIDDLKDGKINSRDIYNYLNALKSGVKIKVEFDNATPEGLRNQFDTLYDNAMKQFDVQEREVDKKYAGEISAATKAVEAAEKAVTAAQDKIDGLQTKVEAKQREIELSIDRPIEALNDSISAIEREIEMQYNRPIADLQEESSDLSNDLAIIDKQAESINKKYDDQQKSLEASAAANKEILEQDKSRLNVASAIASGNAAEVARAIQESRAREAEAAKARQAEALQAARENAIGKLRSANGMTREQIEARQFQIGQDIYSLEEKKEIKSKAVLGLQDQIYAIEEKRKPLLDSIRIIEDQIYGIQTGELATAQSNLKTKQEDLQKIEDRKKLELEAIALNKQAWDDAKLAADSAEVAANNYIGKLTTAKGLVEAIKNAWNNFNTVDVPDVTGKLQNDPVPSGGSTGGNTNGSGNGNNTAAAKPTTDAGYGKRWVKKNNAWVVEDVPKPTLYQAGKVWVWNSSADKWDLETYKGGSTPTASAGAGKKWVYNSKTNDWATAAVGALGAADNPYTPIGIMPGMSLANPTNSLSVPLGKYAKIPAGFYVQGMSLSGNNAVIRYGNAINADPTNGGKPRKTTGAVNKVEVGFDGKLTPWQKFNTGGMVGSKFNMGSDNIPSLLTPGEFVVNRSAVRNFGTDGLKAINSGSYEGESVYNYSVNVNVQTDANAEQIARQVMTQIKRVDSQRIRGNRFNG
jgi:hypothetical protein